MKNTGQRKILFKIISRLCMNSLLSKITCAFDMTGIRSLGKKTAGYQSLCGDYSTQKKKTTHGAGMCWVCVYL